MALISSLGALLATALFALVGAALGNLFLGIFKLKFDSDTESILCSAAVGVAVIEVALFGAQLASSIRLSVGGVLIVAAVAGSGDIRPVLHKARNVLWRLSKGSRQEKLLASFGLLLLALEGIAAMAPLTGSDALDYHFVDPLRVLRTGFHPDFFFTNSFYTGQGHLLILTGLAAGSEKLAMGLIFLGGALSAGAAACLARHWMSKEWALLVALAFLATPVVFWQASTSGNPDIWMSFFVTVVVIVLARMNRRSSLGYAAVAGILAGAIAGAKYTGCLVAFGVLIAFIWESRSFRGTAVFLASAVAAGIWPFARNWAWTGDPMFPYLLHWLAPGHVNAYTLASQAAAVGKVGMPTFLGLLRFSVFASLDPSSTGFWEFLGPLPLAFIPAILLAVRNTPAWRASLIVWLTSAVTIGATTNMSRYFLALFPLVLAAVFAGVAQLGDRGWRIADFVTRALVYLSILAGAGGLLLYSHAAVAAAVGKTSRQDYLLSKAPDYGKIEFVNQSLDRGDSQNKALVFSSHVYYLRVPFIRANPDSSWAIDPLKFQTNEDWQRLFREQHIEWVVRAPSFPETIAEPLNKLEAEGALVPFAEGDVNDFADYRITGVRTTSHVVILRVAR